MKKLLLILGMTNFIAIETSLIISCSDKLTKPIERPKQAINPSNGEVYEFSLSRAIINWQDSSSKRNLVGFSNFNKDELVNLPKNMIYSITWYPSFRFTGKTVSNLLTGGYDLTKPGKVDAINIKGKIYTYNIGTSEMGMGADWQYDWLELMFTSSPLPEKDNEQLLPIEQPKPRADHLKI